MKTRLLMLIIIATAILSSVATAIIIPKETVSFYPEWLEKNIDAAHKINDSSIPIIGVDVDEQLAVLTIYMTDENSSKYSKAIDELIDVPYEILTDTESREITCLRLYKDIRELSRTTGMALAERNALENQRTLVEQYVETKCPDFPDLELMHQSLKNIPSDEWAGIQDTTLESESHSEINHSCMTLEQSKDMAPFFKVPSYLPEGYSVKCSSSGMPYESYVIYHNKDVSDGWKGKIPNLVDDGAIFIHQVDERNMVDEKKYATLGSAEQRMYDTYDSVMESNPSLQPQLIRINGMLAYAVDSCPDCGMQTADFPDNMMIQKSTSTETKIKFIDEDGITYMLKTTLSLDELIRVAESLQ